MFTIGHSTRPIQEFVDLILSHGSKCIVDVRTVPRSRHNPQFNRDILPLTLEASGIGYVWLSALGGLRRSRPDSLNTGWRNLSFRGYADYMQTPEFEAGLKELLSLPDVETATLMCAEAVPWRCHRSLIADALSVRGFEIEHIMGAGKHYPHKLTPWARLRGGKVIYPSLEEADAPQ